MTNIISLQDLRIKKEMDRIIKGNDGNGYSRIYAIIKSMESLGKTTDEILETLKRM